MVLKHLLMSLTLGAHARVVPCLCPSVCLLATTFLPQGGQEAVPTGSALHWLDFKCGDFRENTALKGYGVKPSEQANCK